MALTSGVIPKVVSGGSFTLKVGRPTIRKVV